MSTASMPRPPSGAITPYNPSSRTPSTVGPLRRLRASSKSSTKTRGASRRAHLERISQPAASPTPGAVSRAMTASSVVTGPEGSANRRPLRLMPRWSPHRRRRAACAQWRVETSRLVGRASRLLVYAANCGYPRHRRAMRPDPEREKSRGPERAPRARLNVTTAGSDSGTATTARLTAVMSISSRDCPRAGCPSALRFGPERCRLPARPQWCGGHHERTNTLGSRHLRHVDRAAATPTTISRADAAVPPQAEGQRWRPRRGHFRRRTAGGGASRTPAS
jgi:hypothetical protein